MVFDTEMRSRKGIVKEKAWNESTERSRKDFCTKKLVEFCKRTDLHGYKYIVMKDLSLFEKSCWALAVVVSIMCAGYFVVTAYKWYARNPIVTVIESTHGAIWDVPFPAVTICPVNLVSRRAAWRVSKQLMKPSNITSEEVFEILRIAPLLHTNFKANQEQIALLAQLQDILDLNELSIPNLFRKISPASSCRNLLQRCMWKNTMYRCELLFHPIFTQFNLCCTFNYFALNKMDLLINQTDNLRLPTPRRVASCGYQTALTLLLNTETEDYYSTIVASYGALVIIDNAYNFPDLDSPIRLISPSMEMFIALTPERTYATNGIRMFSPEARKCYFQEEVKVETFRHYTYHNCMVYRKVEVLKRQCQCVPFYYPSADNTRVCNFSDLECMRTAYDPVERLQSEDAEPMEFECYPDCEHYDYPIEVALGILATDAPLEGLTFFKDLNLVNKSLLNVYFNDLVSTRYRRDVYLNWQNLLAAFGGLLSLMLGFTLISVIDFVIFFTFKMGYEVFSTFHSDRDYDDHNSKMKINQVFVQEHKKKEWDTFANNKGFIRKY